MLLLRNIDRMVLTFKIWKYQSKDGVKLSKYENINIQTIKA